MCVSVETRNKSRLELLQELEPFVATQLTLLPSVERTWQPSDILPMGLANLVNESSLLVQSCRGVSWETMVVVVGNAITEDALPSYSSALRRVEVLQDMPGDSPSPWMQWVRAWTAEENRHGELLTRFLLLSGRVDGSAMERTTHTLIRNGFDTADGGDPVRTFVYTAFQERATKTSHINVARLAQCAGVSLLAKICRLIAAEEARHEEIYTRFMKEIFRLDADTAVMAYSEMMRSRITMPARLMGEENGVNLFEQFSQVAETLGVYTSHDYISIIEHLNSRWDIAHLTGLSSAAAEQQEYLCELPHRTRRVLNRVKPRTHPPARHAFGWILP